MSRNKVQQFTVWSIHDKSWLLFSHEVGRVLNSPEHFRTTSCENGNQSCD